jgi:hypothetical protein
MSTVENLRRRAERLADLVRDLDPTPTEADRERAWLAAFHEVLAHMPADRAAAVVAEVHEAHRAGTPLEALSAITRRVYGLATHAAPPEPPGGDTWPHPRRGCRCYWHCGPGVLALPEAVCQVLDAHPAATFRAWCCVACGYYVGEDLSPAWYAAYWRAYPRLPREAQAYLRACPLCGGAIGWWADVQPVGGRA